MQPLIAALAAKKAKINSTGLWFNGYRDLSNGILLPPANYETPHTDLWIDKYGVPYIKRFGKDEYVRTQYDGQILTCDGWKELCLNTCNPNSWSIASGTKLVYPSDNIGPLNACRFISTGSTADRYYFWKSTISPASGAPTGKMFVRVYYKAGSSSKIYMSCKDATLTLLSSYSGVVGSATVTSQTAGSLTIIKDVQDITLGCRVLEFIIDFFNKSNSLTIGIGPYSSVADEYITVLGASVVGAIGTGDITSARPFTPTNGSVVTNSSLRANLVDNRGLRFPIVPNSNITVNGLATGSNLVTTNSNFSGWSGGKPTGYTVKEHFFDVISSQTISGVVQTTSGQSVTIYWGDGTSNTYTGTTDQAYSKDYGSVGNRTVTIVNKSVLTKFTMTTTGTNIKLDLSSLPSVMTYFYCAGSNTITGNLSSLPSVMTSFTCYGNNTITGNLSSLPSVMTYFVCSGSNTITGNLSSLPSVMATFLCAGSNTITGNLSSLPSVMTYFLCSGSNTISDYTTRVWPNNMRRVYCNPTGAGGLSSGEVDQLLIDLALVTTWSTEKEVYLKGTNAIRTSASDVAVATLVGKGVSVIVNP